LAICSKKSKPSASRKICGPLEPKRDEKLGKRTKINSHGKQQQNHLSTTLREHVHALHTFTIQLHVSTSHLHRTPKPRSTINRGTQPQPTFPRETTGSTLTPPPFHSPPSQRTESRAGHRPPPKAPPEPLYAAFLAVQ